MPRTGAGTLIADKGAPPRGTFAFVLRKPGIVIRPYIVRFYDGTAVARDVVHPDGIRAATIFLNKPEQARRAMRLGWLSATPMWHKHLGAPDSLPAYPGSEMPQGKSTGWFAPPEGHPEPTGDAGMRNGPDGGDELLDKPPAPEKPEEPEEEAPTAPDGMNWPALAGMGFRTLQRAAKKETLSAAGSADALRVKLAKKWGISVPAEVLARVEG